LRLEERAGAQGSAEGHLFTGISDAFGFTADEGWRTDHFNTVRFTRMASGAPADTAVDPALSQ